MMISLYRTSGRGTLEYRSIRERRDQLVTQLTTYRTGGIVVGGGDVNLGRAGSQPADRAARTLIRRALADGYRVLYAFVGPEASPLTHACLIRLPGVQVAPDPADGIPVWHSGRRPPGARPSYLLFTVLISAAK